MRKERGHLPFFGIGPLYVGLVCGLTAAGVWASDSGLLESGIVPGLKVPMRVAGVLVALAGLFIWLVALLGSRIDDGIRNNRLVTDGVYAWCRDAKGSFRFASFFYLFQSAAELVGAGGAFAAAVYSV